MRTSIAAFAAATALAVVPAGQAHADEVCVEATVSGLVTAATGPVCGDTPFPTGYHRYEAGHPDFCVVIVESYHP